MFFSVKKSRFYQKLLNDLLILLKDLPNDVWNPPLFGKNTDDLILTIRLTRVIKETKRKRKKISWEWQIWRMWKIKSVKLCFNFRDMSNWPSCWKIILSQNLSAISIPNFENILQIKILQVTSLSAKILTEIIVTTVYILQFSLKSKFWERSFEDI